MSQGGSKPPFRTETTPNFGRLGTSLQRGGAGPEVREVGGEERGNRGRKRGTACPFPSKTGETVWCRTESGPQDPLFPDPWVIYLTSPCLGFLVCKEVQCLAG